MSIIRSQSSLMSFVSIFSCFPMLVLMPLAFKAPILSPFLFVVIAVFFVFELFYWVFSF